MSSALIFEGEGFSLHRAAKGVGLFALQRPARLNALTRAMLDGLAAALDALEADGSRVLIVTGEGSRAFCAGTDLAEIRAMPADERLAKNAFARDLFFRISQSPLLSVAALNGLAYGGGLELAMACSFRVAPPAVKLALPEIKLGLLPAYGGTQFLPALVGRSRALAMMLDGEPIDARTGFSFGLIDRLVPDGEDLLEHTFGWVSRFTRHSQPAIDGIRRAVNASGAEVTRVGLGVEDREVRAVFGTADAKEGVAAFLEKRPARFEHR